MYWIPAVAHDTVGESGEPGDALAPREGESIPFVAGSHKFPA
jgi:hypothetical protein